MPTPPTDTRDFGGRLVRLEAQVLGHLLVQRGVEDGLGELFEQLFGPVIDKPCCLAIRTSSVAASCSADASAFFLATASIVVITAL
ncbi:hypothetical protein IFM12275_24060 [Nocardia sputorum]|nr:hypothetical protein IFM12275_24060 [Nocardia sputorum]